MGLTLPEGTAHDCSALMRGLIRMPFLMLGRRCPTATWVEFTPSAARAMASRAEIGFERVSATPVCLRSLEGVCLVQEHPTFIISHRTTLPEVYRSTRHYTTYSLVTLKV